MMFLFQCMLCSWTWRWRTWTAGCPPVCRHRRLCAERLGQSRWRSHRPSLHWTGWWRCSQCPPQCGPARHHRCHSRWTWCRVGRQGGCRLAQRHASRADRLTATCRCRDGQAHGHALASVMTCQRCTMYVTGQTPATMTLTSRLCTDAAGAAWHGPRQWGPPYN